MWTMAKCPCGSAYWFKPPNGPSQHFNGFSKEEAENFLEYKNKPFMDSVELAISKRISLMSSQPEGTAKRHIMRNGHV
jgi:hypothetical protein